MEVTPYPTVFEVIRFIAKSFDTKASNKELDDLSNNVFADYRKVDLLIEQTITQPLTRVVSDSLIQAIKFEVQTIINLYLELVSIKSVDGLIRSQLEVVLVKYWFVPNAINAMKRVFSDSPRYPPLKSFINSESTVIASVLEFVERKVPDWNGFLSKLSKEKKDQLHGWKKGAHVPNLSSLKLLCGWDDVGLISKNDWTWILDLLVLARCVDSIKSYRLGPMALAEFQTQLSGTPPEGNPYTTIEELQARSRTKVEAVFPTVAFLVHNLKRTARKQVSTKSETREKLDWLKNQLLELGEYESSAHKVEQLNGRWYVFSGDLKAASNAYSKSIEAALYRAGSELEGIIEEAMSVACMAEDRVLIRKIKNAQILFHCDLKTSDHCSAQDISGKTDEFVQDWEIRVWAKHFSVVFPAIGLFPDAPYYDLEDQTGFLVISKENYPKPDYRYPDRKFKLGAPWKKQWPQLCWFILQGDFEVIEKLMDKGARVDVLTSSGDTPLIMALEKLVIMEWPPRSLDDRYVELVLSAPNVEKTVNIQTHKRKLTPLIQAVGGARPDIVSKLLKLGAEVDLRGETDGQTALNVCLKLIGVLKRPEEWLQIQRNHPLTPELLDSLRRYSNGVMGATLSSQNQFLAVEEFGSIREAYHKFIVKRLLEHASLSSLHEILILLLKAGANPNLSFNSPRPGYTAVMLAAELDLKDELELMLMHGADLDISSPMPIGGYPESTWDIAIRCKSKNVLRLLGDIERNYYSAR